jgi:phage gp29-like protein
MSTQAETWNTHPAFDLTLETLMSYYRQAERGGPTRQMDAFHDIIEMDPDLRSKINDRIEGVGGCEWAVMAGRGDKPSELAAGALNERLQNQIQFRHFLTHQLTAVHYGYANTNMAWDLVEGVVTPTQFENPAQRRFASPSVDRANEIWLQDFGNGSLIPLEPGLWATSIYRNILGRNPFAAGNMRSCAVWSMFKRWSVRDWQVYADMFGIPLAVGYYEEGASPKSKDALEDAVRAIGQDGYAVLSALTEIVIKETARGGDSSTVYPQIVKLCEEQISKLLTGGTLNTDVSGIGSYNAASVHETRAYTMKVYDAACVQETFVRDIGQWFNRFNGYDRAAPSRLKLKIRRDALVWAQTLEIVGQVIELDQDQMREDFALRAPAPGRGVKFEPTPAPKPGDPARGKDKGQ